MFPLQLEIVIIFFVWLLIVKTDKPLSIVIMWGFPCGSAGKEYACNVGDLDSIPGLEKSPGEGKGYPFFVWLLIAKTDKHLLLL